MALPSITGYIRKPLSNLARRSGDHENRRRGGSDLVNFERLYGRKYEGARMSNQPTNPLDEIMFQLEQLGIDDFRIAQFQQTAEQVTANGADQFHIKQSLSRTLRIIRENAIGDSNMVFEVMVRKLKEIDDTTATANLSALFVKLKQLGLKDNTTSRFRKMMAQLADHGVTPSQQVEALNRVLTTAIHNGIGNANTISEAMEQTLRQALTDITP